MSDILLNLGLSLYLCLSVRMAIPEVKKEPIEREDPTEYKETLLKEIIKPPQNKVSLFDVTEIIINITMILILYK